MLLLFACGPAQVNLDGTKDETDLPTPAPPTLSVAGTPALDPLLAPTTAWTFTTELGDGLQVELVDGDGVIVRTYADGSALPTSVTLDTLDEAGEPLPLGAYVVRSTLLAEGESAVVDEQPLWIVRVGVLAGVLGGDTIPLVWHRGGADRAYYTPPGGTPTFQLSSLEDETGARPIPEVWGDLDAPPEAFVDQNLPAAYPWNAQPTLALTTGGTWGDAPLSLGLAGWTPDVDAPAEGDVVTFRADAPLAAGLGVVEQRLVLEWRVDGVAFATQEVPVRVYALFGPPAFDDSDLPHLPWLAVIDPLLRARPVDAPDFATAAAAVVDHVYWDQGLAYDTASGASAYTSYQNGYDDALFDLTSFLSRRRGSVVNCTDCAGLVETFGKMVGLDLSYAIVLSNFELNYIRAIGGDTFTHCPFDSGRCGFRYHAVVTPDDTATIYDGTLALDGDDDPSAAPSVERMVHAVPGEEYLDRLVMSGTSYYDHVQHGDFR